MWHTGSFCCGRGTSEHTGSVVAVPRFSCSAACGTLVPQSGIEPRTLALEAESPNHWTTREAPCTVGFAADTQCVYTWEAESSQGFCICILFSAVKKYRTACGTTSEQNCSLYFVRIPIVLCRSEHLFQSLHDIRQKTLSHRPESLVHAYQYLPTRMRAGTSCSVHMVLLLCLAVNLSR